MSRPLPSLHSHPLYPLSVDLAGKTVLMAGAGAVAARKLPELIRCGAEITVVAPDISPPVARLAASLRLERRPYRPGDEAGKYLVFACTGDGEVNRRIAEACRASSILCNVADDAGRGSFHVPGVIRQGSVTVTVGTGGAAPGLTRHLKRVLAAAMGPAVAEAAGLLAAFRARLKAETGDRAAAILENLPYRALLEALQAGDRARAESLLAEAAMEPGRPDPETDEEGGTGQIPGVDLVGAGPGHPGLLTVLASDVLRRAEVIVHDRLIPEEVLQLAPPSCLLVSAGKRGHFESARQSEIEARLVREARAGRRVVRLKGGDPFIFGRGWEEVLALEAAGIPWRVVPGVSSATAGPAFAGIPLTHRGMARSFAVMSGMAYSATNTEIPKADTIILLMGLQRLDEIVPAFLERGWMPETPAAAIQNATLPDQRICLSTLARIGEETSRRGFDSPTLLVIGATAALAGKTAET